MTETMLNRINPVAVGHYLKSLRFINGERMYDQANRLATSPFLISELERGEGSVEYRKDLSLLAVKSYGLNQDQARVFYNCFSIDEELLTKDK